LILLSWDNYHYTSQGVEEEGTREMITEQIEIEHETFFLNTGGGASSCR
jgi:hypothetical protein